MAFIMGFVLDLFLGDPEGFPHPVRWIGFLISKFSNVLLKKEHSSEKKRKMGTILVFIVITISALTTALILVAAYWLNVFLGAFIETVITYQCLAAKSLYTESMKVYYALKDKGTDAGRKVVAMIVGRDTDCLDETGVIKAAVETVAENTSDGVIAPMLYLALLGPIFGIVYKAINTMDSMIGYKNEKYIDFGRTAAKLDDVVNFIPARISALLMIFSSLIFHKNYDWKNAIRIYKRDRFKHASPNSAQTESACAGALCVQLAGPASYFGKLVDKPFIGDGLRNIQLEDIKRANELMLLTSVFCEIICVLIISFFIF